MEGWVEFLDKKVAKLVAESINNTPIGGPKKFPFREDLWNVKYLKDFKWHNLHEKIGKSNLLKYKIATLQGLICLFFLL